MAAGFSAAWDLMPCVALNTTNGRERTIFPVAPRGSRIQHFTFQLGQVEDTPPHLCTHTDRCNVHTSTLAGIVTARRSLTACGLGCVFHGMVSGMYYTARGIILDARLGAATSFLTFKIARSTTGR